MYNRYIPNGASYTRILEEDAPSPHHNMPSHPDSREQKPQQSNHAAQFSHMPTHQPNHTAQYPHTPPVPPMPFGGALEGVSGFLSSLLNRFDLGGLDTGDILLLLIILFIFLEGDDIEMVIVLGLMLLFGLGDKKDHPKTE